MKSKVKLLWLFICCALCFTTQAQEIITSSGSHGTTTDADLSWTIGEIITETAESTNSILTQGFNQGELLITKTVKTELPNLDFNVYPNPASDLLKLVTNETNYENLRFILYDFNGKKLIDRPLTGRVTDIPLNSLRASTYFLKIYQNKTEITLFKIIKK
jgi:hypothetical protein